MKNNLTHIIKIAAVAVAVVAVAITDGCVMFKIN